MTTTPETFTAAGLARELKLDPKAVRRKIRANASKAKPAALPKPVGTPGKKNTRYEWANTAANKKAVTAFIKS